MSDIINIQFNVAVGNTYKIAVPVERSLGSGYYPRTKDVIIGDRLYTPKAGFILMGEDDGIGILTDAYPKELAIDFKPLVYADYEIFFYSLTGEVVRFGATPVEVHDHASIMTGGPAYGTYYTGLQPTGDE